MTKFLWLPLATLRTPVLVALVALPALCMTGCAGLSGNAVYKYQKTGDDCTLTVDTGRVLAAGIAVTLEECDVKVEAPSVGQGANPVKDVIAILDAAKGGDK